MIFSKKNINFLLFAFCLFTFLYAPYSFAAINVSLNFPAPPTEVNIPLPEYMKYLFDLGMAIGFFSILLSLTVSGVFFILSSGIVSMRSKAKDWLSGAVTGFLIFTLLYLIITTIYPPLAVFKPLEQTETPNICPDRVENPDGTFTCPQNKLHGVYFYEGTGCQAKSFPFYSNVSDFNSFSKNIKSVKIIQETKLDIYHIAIVYDSQNYRGKCQYIDPNATNCQNILLNQALSSSVYTYNFSPQGTITFYRNGNFNEEGGYLTLNVSDINGFYEKELKTLGFTGERPGSENIADCTVPEDQQDCKMWKKDGSCEKWECPTLADENISSIKIDGDYLVVLEYLPNGANTLIGDFCQAYPKDQDINKFGPKQIKWDSINNSPGIFANYVLIIPIVRN